MSHHYPGKEPAVLTKAQEHDRKTAHFFRRVLHYLELVIAVITIVVLVAEVVMEVLNMVTVPGYFADMTTYLHHTLTIVVGVEFARMLLDTTPATILEVLTVAITRHVILSHDDPLSNVACVACIAGLFAIRRYLVRRNELKEELVEEE